MVDKWKLFLQSKTDQMCFDLSTLNTIKAGKYDLWGEFNCLVVFEACLVEQKLQQKKFEWQYKHPPLNQSVKLASAINLYPGKWHFSLKIRQSNSLVKRQVGFRVDRLVIPYVCTDIADEKSDLNQLEAEDLRQSSSNDQPPAITDVGSPYGPSSSKADRQSHSCVDNYLKELEIILQQKVSTENNYSSSQSLSKTNIRLTSLPSQQKLQFKSLNRQVLPPKIKSSTGLNQSFLRLPKFSQNPPPPRSKTIVITSKVDSSNSIIIDPERLGKLIDSISN